VREQQSNILGRGVREDVEYLRCLDIELGVGIWSFRFSFPFEVWSRLRSCGLRLLRMRAGVPFAEVVDSWLDTGGSEEDLEGAGIVAATFARVEGLEGAL